MCCGHRAYQKAPLGLQVLHLENVAPVFLEQTEHFEPKLRLTVQHNMLSNVNDGAWPGRQKGLLRVHCGEKETQI